MSNERRRQTRLPWLTFSAQVKVQRGIFTAEWIEVVPYDYSEFGMGIQTDEQFEIGDKVTLNLQLNMEVGDIQIDQIPGFVRYKEKHHSRFNYGVEFDSSSRLVRQQSTQEKLIHIKKVLQKQYLLQQNAD